MNGPAGEMPDDLLDSAAPVPVLPVCATCGHLRITHRRGRCRADLGSGTACGCAFFITAPARPPAGVRLDLDDREDRTS
ncbi:hypothetical protein [Parafrankia discariae]|uniref:hypothetical protein n=1 Tax=Parafrankia discariae TaxID=365528 RepID=UPI00035D31A7|nr:hypothetical protein [Parafrankia discariae]